MKPGHFRVCSTQTTIATKSAERDAGLAGASAVRSALS